MTVSTRALLLGLGAIAFASPVFAQTAPAAAPEAGEEEAVVIVTGTRVAARSAIDTAVAVDVISASDLAKVGVTEVSQALAQTVPSFNFPRPGLADGTDTIRPATLRGLAPDQTLVLVNSKRRHSASLVNVNGTIGRGSSAVDLNTIPSAAIQAIEVLRDGASAQYGSDAIAGVINVRLKGVSSGGGATVTVGQRRTTVDTNVNAPPAGANWSVANLAKIDRQDGEVTNVSAWVGLPLGEKGFVTITGEILDQAKTIRSAPDWRQQFDLVNGAFDPREATVNRFTAWYGEPDVEQYTLFANAGYEFTEGVEAYGWFSHQLRDSTSAGFFRRPLAADGRNVASIYPTGFLPLINPLVTDTSAALGLKFGLGEWDMDASVVVGDNAMDFTIRNTLNRSLGPSSKTVFDAGGFSYKQVVFNLSGVREYDFGLAAPVNVAAGVEFRRENYEIRAGEPDSYITGTFGGAGGSQVFPGFQPSNQVGVSREGASIFLDVETNLTEALLVGAAVRAESYSDFGETVTGKLSARYDFSEAFALRGSIQNGFRAPSLQQQFFTSTATNFLIINGVSTPVEIGTFPSTSAVGRALGGKALEPEESVNYAIGGVLRVGGFNLTVDAYRIDITNRIVLSENFTGALAVAALTANGITNATGGRFFINGVDT
jgi:iron complex outermembrane receptor protein